MLEERNKNFRDQNHLELTILEKNWINIYFIWKVTFTLYVDCYESKSFIMIKYLSPLHSFSNYRPSQNLLFFFFLVIYIN